VLSRAFFEGCLPENSSLAYAVMHGLVRRLRHANRQIESLALLDVYGRVAGALLHMSELEDGVRQISTASTARTWPRSWARRVKWSAAS